MEKQLTKAEEQVMLVVTHARDCRQRPAGETAGDSRQAAEQSAEDLQSGRGLFGVSGCP